jgi:hypothetical protein
MTTLEESPRTPWRTPI